MSEAKKDRVVCQECGAELVMLKRHLREAHDMSAEDYLEKHSLPADTPMVATGYAEKRDRLLREGDKWISASRIEEARKKLDRDIKYFYRSVIAYVVIGFCFMVQIHIMLQNAFAAEPFLVGVIFAAACAAGTFHLHIKVTHDLSNNLADMRRSRGFLQRNV